MKNEKLSTTDSSEITTFIIDKLFGLKKCNYWVIQRKMGQYIVPHVYILI